MANESDKAVRHYHRDLGADCRRGKAILPDLKKAGATQVAPTGATLDTKRLDIEYSAIEGLPPNPPDAGSGYKTDSFGLHVEKGMTEDELQKMCKKYGCMLVKTGKKVGHRQYKN